MSEPPVIHALVERAATAHPDAAAVIDRDRAITYRELDARANGVAAALVDAGVRRGQRVGLCLDKSIEAVVGLYGIMKTGAAYVPMDVKSPVARLALIAADGELTAVVTSARARALAEEAAPRTALIDAAEAPPIADRPAVTVETTDTAYVLYTSGSTGVPKGVMLSHDNGLAFVRWAVREFAVSADDVVASHAPFHFDLSTFDLFAAAYAGAPVALVPRAAAMLPAEVARFVDRHGVTVWYSVPSILVMLAERGGLGPGALPTLRQVLFAGEVMPVRHLARLMDLLPHVSFANLYGPTETNVCTFHRVESRPDPAGADLPIGRVIEGDHAGAIDEAGALVDPGGTGELLVGGATVMQGYCNDPERTATRLVPDPTGGALGGGPVYRTGDMVRVRDDGGFDFIGRVDTQVKSRGYRIELGEVENALGAHPDVVECAVVAVPDGSGSSLLVGVVAGGVEPAALAKHCSERLPRYMVPERFRVVDVLPRTSTGKIDRQALTGAEAEERSWPR